MNSEDYWALSLCLSIWIQAMVYAWLIRRYQSRYVAERKARQAARAVKDDARKAARAALLRDAGKGD